MDDVVCAGINVYFSNGLYLRMDQKTTAIIVIEALKE